MSANAHAMKQEWRIEARLSALHFVRSLWAFPVARKAIENPIGVLNTFWREPDQTIQPWQFGHKATKGTCLWLDGLLPLKPTKVVGPPPENMTLQEKREWNAIHRAAPGPDRLEDSQPDVRGDSGSDGRPVGRRRSRGRRRMSYASPSIVGEHYKPSCGKCDVPPWEVCACSIGDSIRGKANG